MNRLAVLVLALLLLFGGLVMGTFRSWSTGQAARLASESILGETELGTIEYRLVGHSGPVILGIHGTPGGYDQLAGIGPRAIEAGYRLLLISRPGYLRTPITVGRSPKEQASAYVALLDLLGIERVGVIAISGGGPSGLELAAYYPDRVWALVHLMGVSGEMGPALIEQVKADGTFVERFLMTDFGGWIATCIIDDSVEFFVRQSILDVAIQERILSDPIKQEMLATALRSSFVLPSLRTTGLNNDTHQWTRLALMPFEEIKVPTLVIHGTADTIVPPSMGESVAMRVSNSEILLIGGGDHFLPMTHPEEVFGPIFDFFDRHSSTKLRH